jgi:virginiamycin A acetyltransferase
MSASTVQEVGSGDHPLKLLVKGTIFALGCVLVSPLMLLSWIEARFGGESVFTGCAQLLALVPGKPGALLRGAFYFATLQGCSWQTHIGFGSLFTHRGARVAVHVSMGSYCVIGHAELGPRVMMGSRVSIPSGKRQHFGEGGEIVAEPRYDTVRIGAGCWIGEGAIILADVGAGCIVSAGAVVIKPMPDAAVVGGNPAQVLKMRS